MISTYSPSLLFTGEVQVQPPPEEFFMFISHGILPELSVDLVHSDNTKSWSRSTRGISRGGSSLCRGISEEVYRRFLIPSKVAFFGLIAQCVTSELET